MPKKPRSIDYSEAEAELAQFARKQSRAWLAKWQHRLNKARRLRAKEACADLKVKVDTKLTESDECIGYVYNSTPWVIYVSARPEPWTYPELIAHELAHLIAMLRWRYGGHGVKFTRTLKQVEEAGQE